MVSILNHITNCHAISCQAILKNSYKDKERMNKKERIRNGGFLFTKMSIKKNR